MPTRPARLRKLLESPALAFLMEAHNALSARIAEEAGFNGIWASGLSMAAALGVRDANEASWTQVLDVLEFMADATDAPILMDGDTASAISTTSGGWSPSSSAWRRRRLLGGQAVSQDEQLSPRRGAAAGGG
jgi:hypothetical protein